MRDAADTPTYIVETFVADCGHETDSMDYHIVEWDGRLQTVCGDCYYDGPPEPEQWAHTPREA